MESLTDIKSRSSTIWKSVPAGILIVDPISHVIVDVNPIAVRMIGAAKREIIGSVCHRYVCPAEVGQCPITDRKETVDNSERVLLTAGGEKRSIIKTAVNVKLGGRTHLLESFIDITDRKRAEEEINALAITDSLTGLYNRRGFITLAEQQSKAANRNKSRMWLSFIDLDGMKGINDTLGHEAGDRALIETAEILRRTFRESDIIARIGGDEFALLVSETPTMYADMVKTRLQRHIELHNASQTREYTISMCIGLAHYDPHNPVSLDKLIAMADSAMYANKRTN